MKKILIVLEFMCVFGLLNAQSNFPVSNYYYVDRVPQYWIDDSTSINIIVKNMNNYNAIVDNLKNIFTAPDDEIFADDEDDNIIINSHSLPFLHKDSIIDNISIASDDIVFFTYSKLVNNSRIWLRDEVYVKLKSRANYLSYVNPIIQNYNNILNNK
jgi:hypothetical protein